ncbi:MAG: phosphoribosylglycinamide formyltransferase [Rhodobacteraceae bacterium]|nr:phosphoribosylglycinamide formyltransferase [Paracoccaceae bacterium]
MLISGSGSNMVALADSMTGDHPGRPVLVLSNVPGAGGLTKAQARGIDTATVPHGKFPDRAAFESALTARLDSAAPDVICLAGFMRILTPDFTDRWAGRVLNIHPSLLPKYPGLNTHARAIAAGDTEAGASVHLVTGDLDAGPILGQARVPVHCGDTPESLADRVLGIEHQLYPAVLRRFLCGQTDRLDL